VIVGFDLKGRTGLACRHPADRKEFTCPDDGLLRLDPTDQLISSLTSTR